MKHRIFDKGKKKSCLKFIDIVTWEKVLSFWHTYLNKEWINKESKKKKRQKINKHNLTETKFYIFLNEIITAVETIFFNKQTIWLKGMTLFILYFISRFPFIHSFNPSTLNKTTKKKPTEPASHNSTALCIQKRQEKATNNYLYTVCIDCIPYSVLSVLLCVLYKLQGLQNLHPIYMCQNNNKK